MNKLPRELAVDLKSYVINHDITGIKIWDVAMAALPDDEDAHEFLFDCIFNELDLGGRPSTFDFIDGRGQPAGHPIFICTSAEFASVIDYAIKGSADFDEYEYRDGRIYNVYDETFVDEE